MRTLCRYKWYQNRSLTLMWGSVPFGPVKIVTPQFYGRNEDVMSVLGGERVVFVT